MALAWYLSYPLSIVSPDDWIFNHISFYYWIGLPLTLVSLFAIGLRTRSKTLQCVVALGIFFAIYSLSYYYSMLPGSDSQLFRGLNENYSESNSLVPDNKWHFYYEWPGFFVLTRMITIVTGLELVQLEFILYTLIGSLIVLGLQIYVSKISGYLSFLPVVAFSLAMFSFFNYQAVPFSLATALLILMFAIEKKFQSNASSRSKTILLTLLFAAISLTHLFVSLFFILYLATQYLLHRRRNLVRMHYLRLLFITTVTYLSVQLFQAPVSLNTNFRAVIDNVLSSELSSVMQATFSSNLVPIDTLAQTFSRISFFLVVSVCGFGFLILIYKKRLENVDKAFFLSGLFYFLIGNFLPILGSRAIAFIFIPISLGVYSFIKGRRVTILKTAFLVCLILFTFTSIHRTFFDQVHFQTKEVYIAENFMLRNYSWNNTTPPRVVIDFRQQNYLVGFEPEGAYFSGPNSANFSAINEYDCIFYTVGLGKSLAARSITIETLVENSSFNLIYSNGFTSSFVNYAR